MHLDQAKLIWDRLSDVYEGHRTCHDPWFEDFKESLKSMTFEPESSSSSPCLMADGEQVTECYLSESSDEFGPSYVKLASLAAKQQRALEKVQNMCRGGRRPPRAPMGPEPLSLSGEGGGGSTESRSRRAHGRFTQVRAAT